jgi:hypothetical protein
MSYNGSTLIELIGCAEETKSFQRPLLFRDKDFMFVQFIARNHPSGVTCAYLIFCQHFFDSSVKPQLTTSGSRLIRIQYLHIRRQTD